MIETALIIGAGGFVGDYLIRCLADNGVGKIHATKLSNQEYGNKDAVIHDLDIMDMENIVSVLYETRPTHIFHLAAQSSVGLAWKKPGLTIDINIKGSVNVLDAVRELYYNPRILMIGSGEEYGHIRPEEVPIQEENHIRPGNIYAATKACQNMIGGIYAKAYDMDLLQVRAFNHIGPGQASLFVVSDFCKQTAEIEKGLREPVIKVGNLMARRDFTDVRDVVRAYYLLAEKGKSGETYNVGCGKAVYINDILTMILSKSHRDIAVEVDQSKIRPVDVPIIEADITKIRQAVGWTPQIPLEQTIEETLDYWREHI